MTTWTAVSTSGTSSNLFAIQSLGDLPATNDILDRQDFGAFDVNTDWDAVASVSATWTRVYRHGDFGEDSTFGGESFGGTAWSTVAKAT